VFCCTKGVSNAAKSGRDRFKEGPITNERAATEPNIGRFSPVEGAGVVG
jgi:hypothetical protein